MLSNPLPKLVALQLPGRYLYLVQCPSVQTSFQLHLNVFMLIPNSFIQLSTGQ